MRMRVALSVASAIVLVVGAAVVVTAVRSEARESAHPAVVASAVSLARAAAQGTVTVPALSGEPSSSSPDSASEDAASAAASSSAAASRAAADEAAAEKAAAEKAAAEKAAAEKAAAEKAAAEKAAAEKAAAEKAAAEKAAAEKAAAAAQAAAASRAAAASAALSASAAAHPAPDTSDAVEDAVEQAANAGITESVVVMNKQTGSTTTSIDADDSVPAMSLFKIIIAADVIDQAGGVGNVDPDTLAQLHQMIIASDDSIAQDFYDDDGQGAIVTRVAQKYGLSETSPSPEPQYWGDVKITAHDMASLLYQLLSSNNDTSAWFTEAMQGSLDTGADGFDQNFGVNAIAGAGSKQGWGCCLGGVMAIHSMGFTANQIIVVLSTAGPDVSYTKLGTAAELGSDPGAQASVAAVTRTAAAALPPS